jgi:hypothetical protein
LLNLIYHSLSGAIRTQTTWQEVAVLRPAPTLLPSRPALGAPRNAEESLLELPPQNSLLSAAAALYNQQESSKLKGRALHVRIVSDHILL